MVNSESQSTPINDADIAKLLKNQGITIARRTVAKYRKQMDIPIANQRRRRL